MRVALRGNTISIERCDYQKLTICLNDEMVNLDKPVKVVCQGRTLFKGKAKRHAATLRHTLSERGDPAYMFPAQLTVRMR